MRTKNALIIPLGLRTMRIDGSMTAIEAGKLVYQFYRGCRTIAEMDARLKRNGGLDLVAEAIAKDRTFDWLEK